MEKRRVAQDYESTSMVEGEDPVEYLSRTDKTAQRLAMLGRLKDDDDVNVHRPKPVGVLRRGEEHVFVQPWPESRKLRKYHQKRIYVAHAECWLSRDCVAQWVVLYSQQNVCFASPSIDSRRLRTRDLRGSPHATHYRSTQELTTITIHVSSAHARKYVISLFRRKREHVGYIALSTEQRGHVTFSISNILFVRHVSVFDGLFYMLARVRPGLDKILFLHIARRRQVLNDVYVYVVVILCSSQHCTFLGCLVNIQVFYRVFTLYHRDCVKILSYPALLHDCFGSIKVSYDFPYAPWGFGL